MVLTWLMIVLMLGATLGTRAAAETARKPANNAYSIKSWPLLTSQHSLKRRRTAAITCIHRY